MMARRGILWLFLAVGLIAALAFVTAQRIGMSQLDLRLDQSLILTARAVESEIERFRSLPAVAAEDARIRDAIRTPESAAAIDAANRYLETLVRHTGATHLYLMDAQGRTLAASNWDQADSFVGQDYGFRPYFTDALANGRGGFYAIGVTTRLPGYFLSTLIEGGARGPGVLVVKIDLMPLQQTWASARSSTALADADGVVFLSGDPSWLYRPLRPLGSQAQARLAEQRTYDGTDPASAAPLLVDAGDSLALRDGAGRMMRVRTADIPGEGWQLLAGGPVAPVQGAAAAWALAVAVLALIAAGVAKIQRQRRQLVALRLRQSDLLEEKVTERTRALAREIEARRQTEASLRSAQEVLVHSEKMAALGRMSAAIVHEISQPLAAMEATLAAAEMSLPQGDTARTATRIETARGLIRRMQRTTKHLKTFSRKEPNTLDVIALGGPVENALELVQPRARAVGVYPTFSAGTEPVLVRAGAVRLEQVCVNLLLNALDAVDGRANGAVSIGITTTGPEARITVQDTGAGIAPDDLKRVAEPFFSTKESGEGLGLGLAISQAIIAEFGGRIEIESTLGVGTTVTVILPCAQSGREAAE